MDKLFKALADEGRREILDIVKNSPGINVNDLTDHFDYSRFAVMKHIKILEEANLLVSERDGKFKKLYLNAVPIQMINDRWISKFSALWANKLNSLKYQLEQENTMSELKQVYVTYIKSTKEKVWEALTSGALTKSYYYGMEVRSDFTPGSKIEYHGLNKEGKPYVPVAGEIIEAEEFKTLSHTFVFPDMDDAPSRATYTIEEEKGMIKLTLVHDQFESKEGTYTNVEGGWPFIFSGLKTFLETGKPITE